MQYVELMATENLCNKISEQTGKVFRYYVLCVDER